MDCPNCFKPLDTSLTSCDRCGWQISPGMSIPRAEHERIVAEKDARIAELEARSTLAERLYAAQLKHTSDDIAACSRYLCNKALEEAANVADEWYHNIGHGSPGDEIRALKG